MLKLYLGEKYKPDIMETDIEYLFLRTALSYNDAEDALVNEIERGRLDFAYKGVFLDRFDIKLPLISMSTGCKAALCVLNNSDKIISLLECGKNAIDAIVTQVKNGAVWIPDLYNEFWSDNDDIDVGLDNYRFTSLDRLNYYLDNERFIGLEDGFGEGMECLN